MMKSIHFRILFFVVYFMQSIQSSDSDSGYSTDDEAPRATAATAADDSMKKLTEALENEEIFKHFPQTPRFSSPETQAPKAPFTPSSHLSCLDADGNGVDWWFVYKENGGTRFLYYSSEHVKQNIKKAVPLRDDRSITDFHTSPLLKTIYQNNAADDGSVWLAWNDQTKDTKDAYGSVINGTKHAHSKGFYAIKALLQDERQENVVISSYAIMHSLPRFPNIPIQPERHGISKHTLPHPHSIFDTNVSENAQHFMCFNFQRAILPLHDNEVVYDSSSEAQPSHVLFLQKYLKTIHPAIVGTNFDEFDMKFSYWRQYFSFFSVPFPQAHKKHRDWTTYSLQDLPSKTPASAAERNLFPLSTTYFLGNGKSSSSPESRWSGKYSHKNGCSSAGSEDACFAEAVITSTAYQDQITFKLFAKHGASCIDLYDDWAALQLAELQTCFKRDYSMQIPPKHAMLVQTWNDSGTLPKKQAKKIYDRNGNLMATVHINNVGSISFPVRRPAVPGTMSVSQPSKKTVNTVNDDHSKWLLGFTIDSFNGDVPAHEDEAKFIPMFCVGDLNRTKTQAKLSGKEEGRGGGLACTTHRNIWRIVTKMEPTAAVPRFANSGNLEALQIQNRLRPHCASAFHSCGYDRIQLTPFRSHFFRLLRLRSDPLKTNKSVDFVSFLSEMSQFLVRARNSAEKQVFYAFQQFYHRMARGRVQGAAEYVWQRIPATKNLSEALVPILRRLPALVLDRHEPEGLNGPDKKVLIHDKETDEFGLLDGDSAEYLKHMRKQLESQNVSIGIQTEDLVGDDENGEDDEEGEDEDDEDDEDYLEDESEEASDDEDDYNDENENGSDEENNNNVYDSDDFTRSSQDSENYYRDHADFERVHRALLGSSSDEERSSQSDNESRNSQSEDERGSNC